MIEAIKSKNTDGEGSFLVRKHLTVLTDQFGFNVMAFAKNRSIENRNDFVEAIEPELDENRVSEIRNALLWLVESGSLDSDKAMASTLANLYGDRFSEPREAEQLVLDETESIGYESRLGTTHEDVKEKIDIVCYLNGAPACYVQVKSHFQGTKAANGNGRASPLPDKTIEGCKVPGALVRVLRAPNGLKIIKDRQIQHLKDFKKESRKTRGE